MLYRLQTPVQYPVWDNRQSAQLSGLRDNPLFGGSLINPIVGYAESSTDTGGSSSSDPRSTGTGGSSSTDPRSTSCPSCPTNCQTTQKSSTYYAHKQKLNANDIPIVMNVKTVICNDIATPPRMACEAEIAQIKARNGLSGVGCAACSGYNDRM